LFLINTLFWIKIKLNQNMAIDFHITFHSPQLPYEGAVDAIRTYTEQKHETFENTLL
jgi:hypothetical protein